jgi:DNA-binding HxlR family transcriptional regulator
MKTPEQDYQPEMPASCVTKPLSRAVRLLGDAGVLLIIIHLLQGPQRFNALHDSIGHISSKTLSHRLKVLEEMGFVQRQAFLEIPPRVEYQLTATGREFGDVIAAIEQFAERNLTRASPCVLDPSTLAGDLAGQVSPE